MGVNSMKVCFLIGSMSFSGAEKVLSSLTNELAKIGYDIHIILLKEKPGVYEHSKNITIHGVYTNGKRINRIINRIKLIRSSIKIIKPDLVVSFGYVCNINSVISMFFNEIPLVLCERNDPMYDPVSNLDKLKRKLLYPLANGYVFQTEDIQNYFSRKIKKRSVVIPNPVIDKIFEIKTSVSENKKIVTIARLDDYQKNQTMLIKAFTAIADKISDYNLHIYGNGPDHGKYKSLILELQMNNRIFLCGETKNSIENLKGADIFALTSNFEGMPNALIEAMSVGLPCISTDCGGGGAKALISNMENGILIGKGKQQELEEALLLLAKNPDLREQLGKEAYKINEHLNIKRIIKIWIKYFEKIKNWS